jgi:membrane protease YdiL (CAAX protease family)
MQDWQIPDDKNTPNNAPDDLPAFVKEEVGDFAPTSERVAYRGTTGDPIFGLLLALAISVGLTPLLPEQIALRYTLAWAILAGFSVFVWLLGTTERITEEPPENIIWGIAFGFILSVPFLIFGASILSNTARLIFSDMSMGVVLAYLLFVMPMSESLFFRGVMQYHLNGFLVGGLATLWQVVLFFPVFWADVLAAPAVALMIAVALLMMNMLYSYVRERNSLASSWLTQIVANLLMVFLPFL